MKPAQYAIITKALLRAAERAQVPKKSTRIKEVEEKNRRSVVDPKSTNIKMKTNNSIGNQKETAKKKAAVNRNRNKKNRREANRILANLFKSSKYVVGASKKQWQ